MNKTDRKSLLPAEMQGEWIDADDPTSMLVVDQGEIVCFGTVVNYDYKLTERDEGAIMVSLKIEDEQRVDEFQSENVTELVITPEGDFHAYNVSFSTQFVRVI